MCEYLIGNLHMANTTKLAIFDKLIIWRGLHELNESYRVVHVSQKENILNIYHLKQFIFNAG